MQIIHYEGFCEFTYSSYLFLFFAKRTLFTVYGKKSFPSKESNNEDVTEYIFRLRSKGIIIHQFLFKYNVIRQRLEYHWYVHFSSVTR